MAGRQGQHPSQRDPNVTGCLGHSFFFFGSFKIILSTISEGHAFLTCKRSWPACSLLSCPPLAIKPAQSDTLSKLLLDAGCILDKDVDRCCGILLAPLASMQGGLEGVCRTGGEYGGPWRRGLGCSPSQAISSLLTNPVACIHSWRTAQWEVPSPVSWTPLEACCFRGPCHHTVAAELKFDLCSGV